MLLKIYEKKDEKNPIAVYGGSFNFSIKENVLEVKTENGYSDLYENVINLYESVGAKVVYVTIEKKEHDDN